MSLSVPADARAALLRWTDCLLDPARSAIDQLAAASAWYDWALATWGVDENDIEQRAELFRPTKLSQGKAISPLDAARCVCEFRRTAVFLQGMAEAIRELRSRFPGKKIHVLEAGCGPLAPLALPFALRFPADEMTFTLLDLHASSLDAVRRIVSALGLETSVRYLQADATAIRFPDEARPDLIACEVLLRGLTREPQVAATLNLAPQLKPGGLFLPERITVEAALFDVKRHVDGQLAADEALASSAIVGRTPLFSLVATEIQKVRSLGSNRFAANSIHVPPHDAGRTPLRLFTRVGVYRHHVLRDFDSSLNLPEPLEYPEVVAQSGGRLDFVYSATDEPGLRVVNHSNE